MTTHVFGAAVLADISGTFLSHERVLPERTPDFGQGGWVGAARASVYGRIPLKIQIETGATVRVGVAFLLAEVRVVSIEEEETEIGSCFARTGVALKSASIALWSWGLPRLVRERLKSVEAFGGVR